MQAELQSSTGAEFLLMSRQLGKRGVDAHTRACQEPGMILTYLEHRMANGPAEMKA
jgi:hypothetical protein